MSRIINVSDSDTDREEREWQQARNNPINEAELIKKYRSTRSNASGQLFEREILAGCRNYQRRKVAIIDKTPEPFRVTSKSYNGIFTGRFTAPAQPDFQGTLSGGRSIVFEAKATSKDRINRNVLTDTQMEVLAFHHSLGALCAVCICIHDEFFFVPWENWRDMKAIYGRQYLKPDDITEYKVRYDGAVHFLDKMWGYVKQD